MLSRVVPGLAMRRHGLSSPQHQPFEQAPYTTKGHRDRAAAHALTRTIALSFPPARSCYKSQPCHAVFPPPPPPGLELLLRFYKERHYDREADPPCPRPTPVTDPAEYLVAQAVVAAGEWSP